MSDKKVNELGGFFCPDDSSPITPHGGVLDVKKKQVVFWGVCVVCAKEGRKSKVIARVDLDLTTFRSAKEDGMVWCVIQDSS